MSRKSRDKGYLKEEEKRARDQADFAGGNDLPGGADFAGGDDLPDGADFAGEDGNNPDEIPEGWLEESPEEREREEILRRRQSRRRKDSRARGWFMVLIIILLAAALAAVYTIVLVPRYDFLPAPSALIERFTNPADSGISIVGRKTPESADAQGGAQTPESLSTGGDSLSGGQSAVQRAGAEQDGSSSGTEGTGTLARTEGLTEMETETEKVLTPEDQEKLKKADLLAQQYDYDGAIALLQGIADYGNFQEVTDAIAGYQTLKSTCVAVDVTTVPHIFYHSLINDTARAFNVDTLGQAQVDGFNAWMCTVDEFDKITQRLYDAGYVYVRLRDLVTETKDADGTVHFTANTNLMLPEGKKAIVLSVDDLSYYHSYEPAGYPDKLVLDENGKVKCHYVDASGTESVGDYDVVPRLESFLEEHPDGCYKGARGLIALTGYNGVFGYRTDTDYVKREHLQEDQLKWLEGHPDYSFDQEVADAKKIAEALKSEGWEFACHTWGHLSVTDYDADQLKADNEKWTATVEPIVGKTDTIIFAHGNDIGSWEGYTSDNDKYRYYKSAGYDFYCNVDGSTPYWVQITDSYVRQGRIDVDGYRLWECEQGEDTSLSHLIDTGGIFDSARPTPVVANGQS